MANQFVNDKKTMLKLWKNLRTSLKAELSDMDHLVQTVNFWSNAPLMTRVLDWDQPKSWPDPWQLIYNGQYDESSVSLGMFYTLWHADDDRWNNRIVLKLIKDADMAIQHIIVEVDNRFMLNYEYNSVYDKTSNASTWNIQEIYTFDGKNHKKLG
jgi:hypothetical protein